MYFSVSFFAACATVVTVGAVFAWLDRDWRRLRYRRAKLRPVPLPTRSEWPKANAFFDAIDSAAAPHWFQSCQVKLDVEHDLAGRLQRRYHTSVVQCVSVLGVGFIITCISSIAVRDSETLEHFAAQYDLVATVYALAWFIAARVINRRFVGQRSLTEILRAWLHLAILFPLERSKTVETALQTTASELRLMLEEVPDVSAEKMTRPAAGHAGESDGPIYSRVEAYWRRLESECWSLRFRSALTLADFGFYLKERPLEQLAYFTKAQERLHEGQQRRESLMLGLYIASVVLAAVKIVNVFKEDLPSKVSFAGHIVSMVPIDWISTALLGLLILSAGVTTALISRNERSLLHSYHAQERRVRRWLDSALSQASASVCVLDVGLVVGFEDIMFNELLDFVDITLRDVIEVPG